jgi:hypothetical protein
MFYVDLLVNVSHHLSIDDCFPYGEWEGDEPPTAQDVVNAMKKSGSKYDALIRDWNLISADDIEVHVTRSDTPREHAKW